MECLLVYSLTIALLILLYILCYLTHTGTKKLKELLLFVVRLVMDKKERIYAPKLTGTRSQSSTLAHQLLCEMGDSSFLEGVVKLPQPM